MENLNQVFSAAATDMYNQGGAAAQGNGSQQASGGPDNEVTDVDFEEVKDNK